MISIVTYESENVLLVFFLCYSEAKMCEPTNISSKVFETSRFVSSFSKDMLPPCKKPKLDILLTQGSPSSIFKTEVSAKISKVEVNNGNTKSIISDDLWGDDIDENQLVLAESQALSQCFTIEKTHHENVKSHPIQPNSMTNFNTPRCTPSHSSARTPRRSGTPFVGTFTAGHLPDTPPISLNISNGPLKSDPKGAAPLLPSPVKICKKECLSLKDKLEIKDGEVKNLRSSLSTIESKLIDKHKFYSQELKKMKEEDERKIQDLEKQLKEINTAFEFKSMELKSVQEKLNQVRGPATNSKNPIKPGKRKGLDFNRSTHFDEKVSKESNLGRLDLAIGNLSFVVKEGSILAKLVDPEILHPSSPDSRCSKVSNVFLRDRVSNEEESISSDAVNDSVFSLLLLYKCDSFSSYSARCYIKQIVKQSFNSFIRLHKKMESDRAQGQLINQRSEELLENSHTVLPLTEKYSLISPHHLYPNEKGIEVRRMLGLTEALVKVSNEAVEIVLNSEFNELNDNLNNIKSDGNNNNGGGSSSSIGSSVGDEMKLNESQEESTDLQLCKKSLLHILRDIASIISSERRTLEYNGVLTGIVVLLRRILERYINLSKKRQHLIVEIIQCILTSCPGPTVIFYTCKLLRIANYYPVIVEKLCTNAADKEVEYEQWYTFKKDTCPITVLCCIVQALGQNKSYLITDVMTQWLLGLLTKDDKNFVPNWLCSPNSSCSTCDIQQSCICPFNLSKVITTLLCEAALVYDSERSKFDEEKKLMFERILQRGILLLYKMVHHNCFKLHLLGLEGQYELFMHTVSMLEPGFPLHSIQKKILELIDLQEAQKEPARKKDIDENDENLNNSIFAI